jgi:hypothetical protein
VGIVFLHAKEAGISLQRKRQTFPAHLRREVRTYLPSCSGALGVRGAFKKLSEDGFELKKTIMVSSLQNPLCDVVNDGDLAKRLSSGSSIGHSVSFAARIWAPRFPVMTSNRLHQGCIECLHS